MKYLHLKTSRRLWLAGCTGVMIAIGGCANDPLTAFNQAWNKDAKGKVEPVSGQPLQIRVPKEGIHPVNAEPGTFVAVRDLEFISKEVQDGPVVIGQATPLYTATLSRSNPSSFTRILIEAPQGNSFVVHGRRDNGAAGSGIKYRFQYGVGDEPNSYVVTLKPVTREVYQQGISGKLPVPNFPLTDATQVLTNVSIVYTFEIDSPYPSDAVTANFIRSQAVQPIREGYRDPLTGKIISTAFQTADAMAAFTVNTYPYHNGSKAVITALVHGKLTSPGMVDFNVLTDQLRTTVNSIVKS